jgi:hypothetical protein
MKNNASSKVMSTILFISLILMLIGGIFQIQHYPYGSFISFFGLGSYIIISLLEINRLKKIIEDPNAD